MESRTTTRPDREPETGSASEIRRIFVVEPQCWGLEHATFNAALLSTILAAFPEAEVAFRAERSHLEAVRALVESHASAAYPRMQWGEIEIVRRDAVGWLRFFAEFREAGPALREAVEFGAQLVIFPSITNSGILALKVRTRRWPASTPVFVVMHGMINRVVGRWPHKPWNWLLNLRVVLRLWQPPALWYLLLGDSLYRSLVEVQPTLVRHFTAIDLPTLVHTRGCPAVPVARPEPIRFGYLGCGNITKGFGAFARIAGACARAYAGVEFLLVGFLGTYRDDTDYSAVMGVVEEPLPVDEYDRRASSLTYVINTVNPADYRLAASSTFVEGLFYGKPGVYLRNPYVESCFESMGDIGYLCDTPEEVLATVRSIIEEFPAERYRQQVENIVRGRGMFQPEAVALRLRAVVDAARTDA